MGVWLLGIRLLGQQLGFRVDWFGGYKRLRFVRQRFGRYERLWFVG
jgi:hypothetical protein